MTAIARCYLLYDELLSELGGVHPGDRPRQRSRGIFLVHVGEIGVAGGDDVIGAEVVATSRTNERINLVQRRVFFARVDVGLERVNRSADDREIVEVVAVLKSGGVGAHVRGISIWIRSRAVLVHPRPTRAAVG